jgi:hypothetical protein
MEDVQAALTAARQRLAAFEEEVEGTYLLARLKRSNRLHPLLIVRVVALLGTVLFVVATTAALVAPMLDRGLAHTVGALDTALGFPFPLAVGVCALCLGAMALAVHQLALGAARNAPMLPDQAKKHQRLMADVKQLEARLAFEGTPRPAVRVSRPGT